MVAVGTSCVAAGAQTASTAIGPNQAFIGLVNGTRPKATIKVVCPGPVRPPPATQTGHPVSGQTLAVTASRSTLTSVGRTGSRGTSISVTFVTPVDAPTVPVTFTRYGTQPLPTSLLLPCSGSTPVVFSPQPTSKTARSSSVSTTYENIAVTPTPVAASMHADSAADGTITGQLGYEGGAYPGGFHPTAGVVQIAGAGLTELQNVPKSGDFTVHVVPARYTLTGCSGTNDTQCGQPMHVKVKTGRTKLVQVVWLLAP